MFHRLFWPAVLVGLCIAFSDVIDAVTIGHSTHESGLAVLGIITPLYILFNVIAYAFALGGSIRFSQLMGDGKEAEANHVFNGMLFQLMGLAVLIAIAGNVLLRPLMFALGVTEANGELYHACLHCSRILLDFTPIFFLYLYLYDFLRSDNDQLLATVGMVVGSLLDVLLNCLFVLKWQWGVQGSIWATVIALSINVAIMSIHFFTPGHVLRLRLVLPNKASLHQTAKLASLGLATSVQELFHFCFELLVNNLLLRLSGKDAALHVAIFDVILNIWYLTRSMSRAATDAMLPLTATFYVEHNMQALMDAFHQALWWGGGLSAALAAVLAWRADWAATMFGMNQPPAVFAIRVFCISVLFDAAITIVAGFLQSINAEKLAGILITVRYMAVLLPLTLILGIINPLYVWHAISLAAIFGSFLALFIVLKPMKRYTTIDKPVFSYMLINNDKDIAALLKGIVAFCEEHGATSKQINVVNMAVEEVCTAIIQNAFTGKSDEYIQVTVLQDNETDFIMHLRDSAVSFNPFTMNGQNADISSQDYMNSIGIRMLKKKSKQFYYRRYQGFNALMVMV